MSFVSSVERLGPLILPELHPSIGDNIQGPSLIEVPDWIDQPLGRFYLYFADHKGEYIRLAYADVLTGPWRIHEPGSLRLSQTHFAQQEIVPTPKQRQLVEAATVELTLPHDPMLDLCIPHIASPDVHVDEENQIIRMYFHGLERFGVQLTRLAESRNGIDFVAHQAELARPYLRIFAYDRMTYGMAMPGVFYRSKNGRTDFEQGPTLFPSTMRHAALWRDGNTLWVFWTNVGDAPEHILVTSVALSSNWMDWQLGTTESVMKPEHRWEGADQPMMPSLRSVAYGRQCQLRDPAIFDPRDGTLYLLYALAGEAGIGLARLTMNSDKSAAKPVAAVPR